jgi:hypothetical protein
LAKPKPNLCGYPPADGVSQKKEFFMKKLFIIKMLLAITLVAGLLFVSCPSGGGGSSGPKRDTYVGYDLEGTTYVLYITDGSSFELIVTEIENRAEYRANGSATSSGGVFTLTPRNGSQFLVQIRGNDIVSISGASEITYDNGESRPVPSSLVTPGEPKLTSFIFRTAADATASVWPEYDYDISSAIDFSTANKSTLALGLKGIDTDSNVAEIVITIPGKAGSPFTYAETFNKAVFTYTHKDIDLSTFSSGTIDCEAYVTDAKGNKSNVLKCKITL